MRLAIWPLAALGAFCLAAYAWGFDKVTSVSRDGDSDRLSAQIRTGAPDLARPPALVDPPRDLDLQLAVRPAIDPASKAFVDWRTGAVVISRSGRSIEQMTAAVGEAWRTVQDIPARIGPPSPHLPVEATYEREAPGAISLTAGRYRVAFAPRAGVRVSDRSREAGAGGVVRIGPMSRHGREVARLNLQAESDPGPGKWYLFAGANSRAVAWRQVRHGDGGDRPIGPSADNSSAFVTTAQAGLAWRAGPVDAGVAYLWRRVRYGGPIPAPSPDEDKVLAFTVSIKPRR